MSPAFVRSTPRGLLRVLATCMLAVLAACPGGDAGPQPVVEGTWALTGGSGFSGSFSVEQSPAKVTSLELVWTSWRCGSVTVNGSVTASRVGGWTLTDRIIDLDLDLRDGDEISFNGTFADDGRRASGTWDASVAGYSCSGTFQATSPW